MKMAGQPGHSLVVWGTSNLLMFACRDGWFDNPSFSVRQLRSGQQCRIVEMGLWNALVAICMPRGTPVPIVNPIRWRLFENRAMLLLDVGFSQTDLWDGNRSFPVARNSRGRDFGA
jgi:hypothetical protein